MFSPSYNVKEAYENIINCDYVLFTDSIQKDINTIELPNNILLGDYVERIGESRIKSNELSLTKDELSHLSNALKSEIELYQRVKKWKLESNHYIKK